jgi:hypothetical protein
LQNSRRGNRRGKNWAECPLTVELKSFSAKFPRFFPIFSSPGELAAFSAAFPRVFSPPALFLFFQNLLTA